MGGEEGGLDALLCVPNFGYSRKTVRGACNAIGRAEARRQRM